MFHRTDFPVSMVSLTRLHWIHFIILITISSCINQDKAKPNLSWPLIQPAQVDELPLNDNLNTRNFLGLKGNVKRMDTKFYSGKIKGDQVITIPLQVGSVIYQDSRYLFHESGMAKEFLIPMKDWKSFWYRAIYYYDTLNRIVNKIRITNPDSLHVTLFRYYYNEAGNMARMETIGNLLFTETFHYANQGRTIKVTGHANGDTISKTIYSIDPLGNTLDIKRYNGNTDSLLYELIYERNRVGVLQSESFIENLVPVNKITYHHDSLGNIEYCEAFTGNIKASTERYTYQLDAHGNWIRRITFVNNEPLVVTERELIYF